MRVLIQNTPRKKNIVFYEFNHELLLVNKAAYRIIRDTIQLAPFSVFKKRGLYLIYSPCFLKRKEFWLSVFFNERTRIYGQPPRDDRSCEGCSFQFKKMFGDCPKTYTPRPTVSEQTKSGGDALDIETLTSMLQQRGGIHSTSLLNKTVGTDVTFIIPPLLLLLAWCLFYFL